MSVKIAFLGAGSVTFMRNIVGDCFLTEGLEDAHFALYDIDEQRLGEALEIAQGLNRLINQERATITMHCGLEHLPEALIGARFVINSVQVGGYIPATRVDFDICNAHGLKMTIGDTLGPAGIFRALRTIPVLETFAEYMGKYCPDALFFNYTNPMGILSGYMQRYLWKNTIGLCHSVQVVAKKLMEGVGREPKGHISYRVAGINHMAWLLDIREDGKDIYPEIKALSLENPPKLDHVRHEMMQRYGYYVTESSEHCAEYVPYFIKKTYPELIDEFAIPLDEYPRRCIEHISRWENMRKELLNNTAEFTRSREYASLIMQGIVLDKPFIFHGNVINEGAISNLPREACVEIPCVTNAFGVDKIMVGALPEQCAALNRTNVNVQLMAIEAAKSHRREDVYRAVYLDPHAAAELSLDEMKSLCDDLFEAHKQWLPEYK